VRMVIWFSLKWANVRLVLTVSISLLDIRCTFFLGFGWICTYFEAL